MKKIFVVPLKHSNRVSKNSIILSERNKNVITLYCPSEDKKNKEQKIPQRALIWGKKKSNSKKKIQITVFRK